MRGLASDLLSKIGTGRLSFGDAKFRRNDYSRIERLPENPSEQHEHLSGNGLGTALSSALRFCVRSAMNTGRRAIERIRILLLHTRVLFRTSLARLLATERDFELVAECGNAADVLESLADARPDVVLFDFSVWSEFVSMARDAGYQGKLLAIAEEIDPVASVRAL